MNGLLQKTQPVTKKQIMPAITTETKQLKNLLEGVDCRITGDIEKTEITGLSSNSRKVLPGNLFAAIQGLSVDGHKFMSQAVAAGCSALLVNYGWQDLAIDTKIITGIPLVEVDDTKIALGEIAATFYEHPDRQLSMIGITGTNGKTTTSFLVESLLKACGKRPGVIGTVNYRYSSINNKHIEMEAPFTTPESPTLFALLREMANEGITDVVMEVSSHALAQARLTGMGFDIAVFTNLSRDHLDFHPDMDHYFSSKKRLFTDYLKPTGKVVIMRDETPSNEEINDWGKQLHEELTAMYQAIENPPTILTCGINSDCDVHPQEFNIDINGIQAEILASSRSLDLKTSIVGEYNLRNILCAIGIGIAHNEELVCIQEGIEDVKIIPGRLEKISSAKNSPTVFVDYAHTPDALENVLSALRQLIPKRLICIFGCGGDRDPGKRAIMGEIAGSLSDVVLATSDNPRSESPEDILKQIEEGLLISPLNRISAWKILSRGDGQGYDVIKSRRQAISTAIRFANPEDVILISGKGHENYQLSSKGKVFFDDRIEAEMQLQAAGGLPHVWKLNWLQQITGGQLLSPADKEISFDNISTDTRSINPGDFFVALKGENFDGKRFAEKAVKNGAAGLLINHTPGQEEDSLDFQPPIPVLQAPDTLFALGELAANRRRWNNDLQVLAMTGSSGKTTVKEMTGAILSQNHSILKTEGNFNNLIGMPLTLLNLKDDHEMAVLEMGMNRPGEIARLTEIADPDIACIINVQEAHLEGLGDIQGVAKAKNELFAGLKPEGTAVVNLDDEIVSSLADQLTQEKITFGFHPAAFVRATNIESLGQDGMSFSLHIGDESRQVAINGIGRHNVSNSLAAAALAHGIGSEIDEIATGLSAFMPYEKRSCVEKLESGVQVLNDCYNANPASMMAALNTLKDLKKDHYAVAVLGDMLELGAKSDAAHQALGKAVFDLGIDFLAAFGSQAENIITSALDAGMVPETARKFNSKPDLAVWLNQLMQENKIKADDWLLIKGSRGIRMEEVLDALKQEPKQNLGRGQ
jgi:murE/murF fusion protein